MWDEDMSEQLILELAKLSVSISVPVILAIVGYALNNRLKKIEQSQWQNRKIIELRLVLFESLAPKFNDMLCFCTWVGDWKSISPVDMIKAKRETDKTVNVYRHLFSERFYASYNDFIHTVFTTFNGAGEDAKIRSQVESLDGNRRIHSSQEWKPEWDSCFAVDDVASKQEVRRTYDDLMRNFRLCIGLQD
jgi:hypothetical protein